MDTPGIGTKKRHKWRGSINWGTQNGWFIMEHPMKVDDLGEDPMNVDDLGVPPF